MLRRVPVRTRVVAALALGSVAISALIAVATWNLTTGYMLQQREASVLRQATVNARLVEEALIRDPDGLGTLLTGLASSPQAAILVRYRGAWNTGGTQTDQLGPGDVPPELLAAVERGETARQRVRIDGRPEIVVTLPLVQADYVEIFPLGELERTFRFISLMLLAGVLASGLLGASLGVWASRRALRPLTELTGAAARVGARRPRRAAAGTARPGPAADRAGVQRDGGDAAGAGGPGRAVRLGRQPRAALAGDDDGHRDGGADPAAGRDVGVGPATRSTCSRGTCAGSAGWSRTCSRSAGSTRGRSR